ncbi:hypothetical protein [Pseudonocardia sp.]|uniref:hypothetical protein n=1 Tax=Pseudonocardia sp. TaxID=60912 RepID=UPI003D0B62AD
MSRQRGIAVAAAWVLAAVVATSLGLLAVGAIGDGLSGPVARPLSPDEVTAQLAAARTAAPAVAPGPAPPGTAAPQVVATAGGTVAARCVDGRPQVVAATPGQGFRVDDPGERRDEVTFESEALDVEVRLACRDGAPVAQVREDRED